MMNKNEREAGVCLFSWPTKNAILCSGGNCEIDPATFFGWKFNYFQRIHKPSRSQQPLVRFGWNLDQIQGNEEESRMRHSVRIALHSFRRNFEHSQSLFHNPCSLHAIPVYFWFIPKEKLSKSGIVLRARTYTGFLGYFIGWKSPRNTKKVRELCWHQLLDQWWEFEVGGGAEFGAP